MNAGYPSRHSSVEHCEVFIQKCWILVRGKAAQGFSPQAQQRCVDDGLFTSRGPQIRGERRTGPNDAIYEWTLDYSSSIHPVTFKAL
jgi:hypothetical protein